MTTHHNKLVRDYVPKELENQGHVARYETKDDTSYEEKAALIFLKIYEEVSELWEASRQFDLPGMVNEAGDILAILSRYLALHGMSLEDADRARREKAERLGEFEKSLFLYTVERK